MSEKLHQIYLYFIKASQSAVKIFRGRRHRGGPTQVVDLWLQCSGVRLEPKARSALVPQSAPAPLLTLYHNYHISPAEIKPKAILLFLCTNFFGQHIGSF